MSEQVPSVGRVVHYVATNGAHVPADICAVYPDDSVNLFVKDSTMGRTYFQYSVLIDASGQAPGSWHWPEFVPPRSNDVAGVVTKEQWDKAHD